MICVWSAVIRHRIRLCTVLGLVMGLVKQLPLGPNGFSEDENACFSLSPSPCETQTNRRQHVISYS